MEHILKFTEHFFWTMVWVLLVLIVAFALLGMLQSRFSGNIIGNFASWVSTHAEPHQ